MYIERVFNPFTILEKKSAFLFGARSTGKSLLLKKLKPENSLYINLLATNIFLRLSADPSILESMVEDYKIVVIDEIQKLPILLDEIHRLIEEKDIRFLMTSSSARKLKKEFSNLLGGRATQLQIYPLVTAELKKFNLNKYLLYGGIPRIYLSEDPELELDAYLQTYLEQEIQIESHIRSLPPFARFLKVAAISNAQLINYASIASDCSVSENTVKEYYQILVDTLIGFRLEPWLESKKRKAITTAKFYFFDLGVRNYICDVKTLERDSNEFGDLFEHFIINEVKAYNSYFQKRKKLYFWRNTSKHEVDLIIDSEIAIEIKSSKKITSTHLKGFSALNEEKIIKKFIMVSNDPIERTENGIKFYYWENFLKQLWSGKIF